jgi:hypothetical protein
LITDQSKKPSNVQYRPVKDFNIRESRPLKSNISQLLFFSFSPTPSFTEKYCFYVDFTPEADHLNANSAIKFRVSLLSFLLAWSVPPFQRRIVPFLKSSKHRWKPSSKGPRISFQLPPGNGLGQFYPFPMSQIIHIWPEM